MMNQRADANMWWIIIGAVIALVVMIILMVMFTGKSTKLEGGLLDCKSKGGECKPATENCPSNSIESSAFSCAGENKCCLSSLKKKSEICNTNAECLSNTCTLETGKTTGICG